MAEKAKGIDRREMDENKEAVIFHCVDGCEITCIKPYLLSSNWSNEERIALRNEMADWPRDEKGKWVKK